MSEASSRAVLITGCSSGIGLCTARTLRTRGYRVFATARRGEDVARLKKEGFEALQLDLDDSASIHSAVTEILHRTDGHLYGLFNNGAYGQPGAVEDLNRATLRAQLETNVLGWLELTNAVLPAMRRAGEGRIIQNSSVLGFAALRLRGAYVTSKFAIEGMSDTLRQELHGTGIHVSLVEPGPIRSAFRANALKAFRRHIHREHSPWTETYRAAEARMANAESDAPFTLGPEAVARCVVHALEARRPRVRYRITFPTKLFAFLKWLLPARAMDAVLRGVSRGENR
ncbi:MULTISPECIES: SDR family oxidoreductase [unclassified Thioalkalivibrio]|uniref:SDR family oxidoreductase n=1 Tax=unclassified Thioalkalivibrio TaxID=2621013 RepID=UPI000378CD49|nr:MULTISPECIES: SDR family oxidoreductase [unclassified Thioalkalivibrio]